jgi:hypothetical protein
MLGEELLGLQRAFEDGTQCVDRSRAARDTSISELI